MHDEVEPGYNCHVQAVQGRRTRALPHGALRAAGAASQGVDAQDPRVPRAALERVGSAPRGVHKQARRCAPQQVSSIRAI